MGLTFEARQAGDNCCRERAGGKDQCGGGNGSRVSRGDAEQLRLNQFAERGGAGHREGDAGGNHDGGVAQDEADGGGAGGAEGEADADLAGAARDHEGHHTVETD